MVSTNLSEDAIAIVGMSGRFPGARNIAEFWTLLKDGVEARESISSEQLRRSGISDSTLLNPNYVRSWMRFDGAELFDAEFFGYSPGQAANIDPQQRLFLECAWEALEDAGQSKAADKVSVGVFGGVGFSTYLLRSLLSADQVGAFQSIVDAEKDFLTSRVAYKLGLTGPSITVQTACSTSLVAVHLACRSLLDFECDLALAGGSSIRFPLGVGYLHVNGGVLSPDGRCRSYDSEASGTTPGSGVGVVAMRRLEDAVADGDIVYAVIRASAVNNDGAKRVGFTAPGFHGQVSLLETALDNANLSPSDIQLFEGHGSGTLLGDSIELEAINQVYGSNVSTRNSCVLGSVKANVGHLDAAAGITGLIKAVLCIKHRTFVPSPHFGHPNPLIDTPESPLYINTALRDWNCSNGQLRRAAVSSFGMGGTNAHVILEEPPIFDRLRSSTSANIFPISARNVDSLHKTAQSLMEFVDRHNDLNLGDVSHTLKVGRREFDWRAAAIAKDFGALKEELEAISNFNGLRKIVDSERPVVLLFPGQGMERCGMAQLLYTTDEVFKASLDHCATILMPLMGSDIRLHLCQNEGNDTAVDISCTLVQTMNFVFQYCVVQSLIRAGIKPAAVIGHSLGEYAAACIAGVLSIEDALQLVSTRGQLCDKLQPGSMIAVRLTEVSARDYVGDGLELAVVNSANQCVISGGIERVRALADVLAEQNIAHQVLRSNRAFHTTLMSAVADPLYKKALSLEHNGAHVPWISSVTGKRVSVDGNITPEYWSDHLVSPVSFSKAVNTLLEDFPNCIILDVGPGKALAENLRHQPTSINSLSVFAICEDTPVGFDNILRSVGDIWGTGGYIDWPSGNETDRPHRVSLPTYSFNKKELKLRDNLRRTPYDKINVESLSRDTSNSSAYYPRWSLSQPTIPTRNNSIDSDTWVIFEDARGLANAFGKRLAQLGHKCIFVTPTKSFRIAADAQFEINPLDPTHYARLISSLHERGIALEKIAFFWGTTGSSQENSFRNNGVHLHDSCLSLLYLMQAHAKLKQGSELLLLLAADATEDVSGSELIDHTKAPLSVLCKIFSQEQPNKRYIYVDLPGSSPGDDASRLRLYAERMLDEAYSSGANEILAYRNQSRFSLAYATLTLPEAVNITSALRHHGCYLVTGGMGKIGFALAKRLATRYQARLLLLSRSTFPNRSEWEGIKASNVHTSRVGRRIRELEEMEKAGAQVTIISGGLTDGEAIASVLGSAQEQYGKLDGVFHLAADVRHSSISRPLIEVTAEDLHVQLKPKADLLLNLATALKQYDLDFAIAFSSNAAVLGGVGRGAYAAANAVLEKCVAHINYGSNARWMSVAWDGWEDEYEASAPQKSPFGRDPHSITSDQGLDILWRIIDRPSFQNISVSVSPLEPRLKAWVYGSRTSSGVARGNVQQVPVESSLSESTEARLGPRTNLELTVMGIWESVLGLESFGVNDKFLDLGGDSLIALRVTSRLKESFGVEISPAALIGPKGTVAELVREIVMRMALLHQRIK